MSWLKQLLTHFGLNHPAPPEPAPRPASTAAVSRFQVAYRMPCGCQAIITTPLQLVEAQHQVRQLNARNPFVHFFLVPYRHRPVRAMPASVLAN